MVGGFVSGLDSHYMICGACKNAACKIRKLDQCAKANKVFPSNLSQYSSVGSISGEVPGLNPGKGKND